MSTQTITGKDRHTGSQATTCEFTLTIKTVREDATLDAVVTCRLIQGTSGPRVSRFDTTKSDEEQSGLVASDLLAGLRAYVGMEQRVACDAKIEGELTVPSTGMVAGEKLQARIRRATQETVGEAGLTLDREITQSLDLVAREKRDAGK